MLQVEVFIMICLHVKIVCNLQVGVLTHYALSIFSLNGHRYSLDDVTT